MSHSDPWFQVEIAARSCMGCLVLNILLDSVTCVVEVHLIQLHLIQSQDLQCSCYTGADKTLKPR